MSVDGYEIHFATNHLGHAMLIRQMLPVLLSTANMPDADVRIVILSSRAWAVTQTGGIVFEKLKTKQDGWWERSFTYQYVLTRPNLSQEQYRSRGIADPVAFHRQSKLANLIYARELAKRFPSITTVSVHPGVVATAMLAGLKTSSMAFIAIENWFKGVSQVNEEEGVLNQVSVFPCVAETKTNRC